MRWTSETREDEENKVEEQMQQVFNGQRISKKRLVMVKLKALPHQFVCNCNNRIWHVTGMISFSLSLSLSPPKVVFFFSFWFTGALVPCCYCSLRLHADTTGSPSLRTCQKEIWTVRGVHGIADWKCRKWRTTRNWANKSDITSYFVRTLSPAKRCGQVRFVAHHLHQQSN